MVGDDIAGGDSFGRGVVSLPGSPRGNNCSVPVVGSAESLVTRVSIKQNLLTFIGIYIKKKSR